MTKLRLAQLESNGSTAGSVMDIPHVQVKTEGGLLYYKIDTDGEWRNHALAVFLFVLNRHRKDNSNQHKFSHPRHYSTEERRGVEYSTGTERTRLNVFSTSTPARTVARTTEFPIRTLKDWHIAEIEVERFFKTGRNDSNKYDMTCPAEDFDSSRHLPPIAMNTSSGHPRKQIECRLAVAINNPDESSWKRILVGPMSESFYMRFEETDEHWYHKSVSMNRKTTYIR